MQQKAQFEYALESGINLVKCGAENLSKSVQESGIKGVLESLSSCVAESGPKVYLIVYLIVLQKAYLIVQ